MPALRPLVVSWTPGEVSGSLSRGERLFFTLLSEPHLLSGALDFVFLLARALKRNLVIVLQIITLQELQSSQSLSL